MANFGDVIVVIPGIFGSRLEREDGSLLYDLSLASLPRTLWNLTGEGLPMSNPDAPPDDGVVATELFNYQLLPGFFGNDDYGALVTMLRGDVPDPDQQVIPFPYDWRVSNRWSAERLDRVVREALGAWRKASGNTDAKLWFVCHSMGGLVARYFCEHLGGAAITRELITISTPHRGAAKALEVLANGLRLGGIIDVSTFVRSLPSIYELLPQYPVLRDTHGDSSVAFRLTDAYGFGEQLRIPERAKAASAGGVVASRWTDPHVNRQMLERAVRFHAAIRNPVVARMDAGEPPPYTLRCFVNRRQPTILSALLHQGELQASLMDPLAAPGAAPDLANRGDGTVPAVSAIPIEWDDTSAAVPVAAKHVGMPASVTVLEALRNWIRPQDARAYMGGGAEDRDVLGVSVPPAIVLGEHLVVRLDALRAANVTVRLTRIDNESAPRTAIRVRVSGDGEPVSLDVGVPERGTWRLNVEPEDRRRPTVWDYVLVLGGR